MSRLWSIIKEYFLAALSVVLGAALAYISISSATIPFWAGPAIIIIGILQFIDKLTSQKEFKATSTSLESIKAGVQDLKKENENLKKAGEEQKVLMKGMVEQRSARVNLVAKLVERGLISEDDIFKHLEGKDAFVLYCYANPAPVTAKAQLKRLYPVFLQEAGFVRIGRRSSFFVTTVDRLVKKLQNPNALKKWLLNELNNQLKAEWAAQLQKLTPKQLAAIYNKFGQGDYSKYLNMNLLIFKTKLGSGNVGLINKNILPTDFIKLLGPEIKLGQLELGEDKKVEVKKFVFGASFKLLFSEIAQDDLKKLLTLEPTLKQKLDITSFMDYIEKAEDDIKKVLLVSFDDAKATGYAKMLKSGAKEYEEALKEMGISTV